MISNQFPLSISDAKKHDPSQSNPSPTTTNHGSFVRSRRKSWRPQIRPFEAGGAMEPGRVFWMFNGNSYSSYFITICDNVISDWYIYIYVKHEVNQYCEFNNIHTGVWWYAHVGSLLFKYLFQNMWPRCHIETHKLRCQKLCNQDGSSIMSAIFSSVPMFYLFGDFYIECDTHTGELDIAMINVCVYIYVYTHRYMQ